MSFDVTCVLQEYVWAITKVIFDNTDSPGEIIPQKVLGATFLTHTVDINYIHPGGSLLL